MTLLSVERRVLIQTSSKMTPSSQTDRILTAASTCTRTILAGPQKLQVKKASYWRLKKLIMTRSILTHT